MAQKNDPTNNDYGTTEARLRSEHILEQPDPRDRSTRRVRVVQDQVDWYARRSYITPSQSDALRRWQADAYLAGLQPSCTGTYAQAVSGSSGSMTNTRIAAQARRDHAIAYLMGLSPHAVPMLDAVACDGTSAGRWMMTRLGGSPHEALEWLRKFSTGLAKHYGFER